MGGVAALLILAALAVPEGLSLFRENRGEKILVPDPPLIARYLLIALLGLGVVIYVVLQFSYASDRRRAGGDQYRKPGWPLAVVFVIVLAFWVSSPGFQGAVRELLDRGSRSGVSGDSAGDPSGVPPQREESKALGLGLTVVLLLLVVSSAAVVRILVIPDRSRTKADRDEALARAIEAGIEDLETITDPRAAVIACYGGMLSFAEAAGFERDLSDTPSQALIRLFNAVRVDRSDARRLTELFERAKFSQHPIDDEMRIEAIAILGRIRESLAVPA